MVSKTPKNIVERIEQTLNGEAWANQTFRGKTKLTSFHFPRPSRNFAGNSDTKLSDFVVRTGTDGSRHSRGYAELSWAKSIAVGIHTISGFETPDKNYIKKVFAARKEIESARKQSKSYWDDPAYKAALQKYEQVWKGKFSAKEQPQAIIQQTHKIQADLIAEFSEAAVSNQLIDHKSLFRLEPIIRQFVNSLNDGVSEGKLFDKQDADLQQNALYNLMLNEEYGADTSAPRLLAQRMLDKHLGEIQAFADTQSHYSKSKKSKPKRFNINISKYSSGGFIVFEDDKTAPLQKDMKDIHGKKTDWSVVVKFKEFDNGRVSLNTGLRIVGRQESNSFITSKPDYESWLERLPHSPIGTEASMSTEQAREAYIQSQEALEAARVKGEQENQLRREQAIKEQQARDAKRAAEVEVLVEQNYALPEVTKDSAKGTQLEKKQIIELLDYPELHGLLRHSSLYDVPSVSIQMGLDTENTRGIQHLANPPYVWGTEEKDNIGNKRFETMNNDMKNCFVQLGDIGPNTTIIIGEGFATVGSLYIAAKRKEIDVVCVAAMFVDNLKYALEHYQHEYPNSPILNAADNDCWNKDDAHSLRSIKDNAGLRMGLILHDSHGIESFSTDWSGLEAHDKAQLSGACDFNDMFEVFDYETALEHMGTQLEQLVENYTTPAKDMVGARTFADAEYGTYDSIFEVYGIDPEKQTSSFITHTGKPLSFQIDKDVTLEKDAESLAHDEAQIHTDQNASPFVLQKLESDTWVTIDVADTVKEALISHDVEKRYAIESAYANLLETETDPSRAFNKALQCVESTFRCFDVEAQQPFNSVDTYNDIKDLQLDNDVVLFIENENGYVRPIRQDANGDLIIGGTKDNVQPRYRSRLDIAKAVDSVLTEIEFREVKAFDLASEESFKLRTVTENNKPDRETDRTFSKEFGLDTATVIKSAIGTSDLGVKFLDQSDMIEVTCNTTSIDNPKLVTEIDKSELGYELENLQANPSVIDIDSGHNEAKDMDLNVAVAGNSRALFVLKSYAPNGAQNGQYYLNNEQEVANKIESLQFANFVIPTSTFKATNGGLIPISTIQEQVPTELLQAQSVDFDQKVDSEQEIKKYIASINDNSVQNNTPSTLPSSETGERKLIDGIWYEGNRAAPVGELSFEVPGQENVVTEQEMAANLIEAAQNESIPNFSDDLTVEEFEYLNDEINAFREEEVLQETQFSDAYTDFISSSLNQNFDVDVQNEIAEIETSPIEADTQNMANEVRATTSLAASIAQDVNSSSFELGPDDMDELDDNGELSLSAEDVEALYTDLSFNDIPTDEFIDEDFDMNEFGIEGNAGIDFDGHETNEQGQSLPDSDLKQSQSQGALLAEEDEKSQSKSKTLFNRAREIAHNGIEGVKALKTSKPEQTNANPKAVESAPEDQAQPEEPVSAPQEQTQPETAESAPEERAQPEEPVSAPQEQTQPETVESAPEERAQPEATEATPEEQTQPETAESAPEQQAQPEATESEPEEQAPLGLHSESEQTSEILSLVLEQINMQPAASYGIYDTKGEWSQSDTLVNKGGTQNCVISSLYVSNDLPAAETIKRTEIVAPSSDKLGQLLQRAKIKAWNLSKTKSSILEQVKSIQENNIIHSQPVEDVEPEQVQDKVVEKASQSTLDNSPETNNAGGENAINGNVVKALETLSQMLSSGDLVGDEVANIIQKFAQVNPSVDSISSKDVDSVTKKQQSQKKAPKQSQTVTNASTTPANKSESDLDSPHEQTGETYNSKGLPVPLSFSADKPINSFTDFEFPSSESVEDFVEKAEVEVGEKGNSAIIKKSTFLMSASVSPDGSVNQLAQNAIDVLCYLRPATDDLTKQEYTAKAGEIANWLNSVAKVGLLIESMREDGRLPVYSKLDSAIKTKVQEALIRPVNEIKRNCNNDYIDFICIKEAIEKRQIPTETLQQVLYGAYKNIISTRTGLHAKRYINSNAKLNDELKVVLKALIKNGDFKPSTSMKGAFVYTDPVDKSEQTITMPDIMAASSQMMALRDIEAAVEIPKDVRNMNSVGREKGRVVVGRAIKEITNIDSPIHERKEPKTAYTPVGRHAKKEAQANVPEGMTH